jgi:hypothetical protein
VGAHDVRIVLARGASEGFERDDQQQDADTGSSEHATAADVPATREEAYTAVS